MHCYTMPNETGGMKKADNKIALEFYRSESSVVVLFYLAASVLLYYFLTSMDIVATLLLLFCMIFLMFLSGLSAQSAKFHPMGNLPSVLFLCSSWCSLLLARILIGVSQYLLQGIIVFSLGIIGLFMSFVSICVQSQRQSKLLSMRFDKGFLDEMEKNWRERLKGHPAECEKIASDIRMAKHVLKFFEDGLFNIAVLWSCNIVEEIVDVLTELIIDQDPLSK